MPANILFKQKQIPTNSLITIFGFSFHQKKHDRLQGAPTAPRFKILYLPKNKNSDSVFVMTATFVVFRGCQR